MARAATTWAKRLAILSMLVATVGGLWYAQRRGWLAPAESWARRVARPWMLDRGDNSANPSMRMDMPGMGGETSSTSPEGFSDVEIAGSVQQRIGVTFGRVERAPLNMIVRTVGIVRPDETRTFHIHVRTEGWIEKLFVNYTGQKVAKGQPFLSIYSPEFYRTQLDYLTARRTAKLGGSLAKSEGSLADLAVVKLRLLDVSDQELKELEGSGKPREFMTLRSPAAGTVLEKNVLEHEYITPQRDLYVVADLSMVWVQARVYEYELPHVAIGQPATVTVPSLPGRRFAGKVAFIRPTLEEATRTVEVRVELPNPDGSLRPGMFADAVIDHDMGSGVLVPASAVIRTGRRDIAFRAGPDNRFVPVEVHIGEVKFGDRFQVLEGLAEGDRVVTSANFLIDSESRLKLGGGGMAGMDMGGMDMGGTSGKPKTGEKGTSPMKGMDGRTGMDHSKMKN